MYSCTVMMIFGMVSQWVQAVECTGRDVNSLIIIPHAANDLQSVEWAVRAGANAVEGDLKFNRVTGDPTAFHHGIPCDCTCYALGLTNTTGTMCSIPDICQRSTPPQEWLSILLRFPTLAMVYIDSKTDRLSTDVQRQAGTKVITMLENHLFDKGFKGNVHIGSQLEKLYLEGIAAQAKESVYSSQITISWDIMIVNPTDKLRFLKTLTYPNIVYTTGTTACFEVFSLFHGNCREAVEYREKGVFKDVIIWTLDTTDKIESYYALGARGFITNNVAKVTQWAKLNGIQLAQPGDRQIRN